MEPNPKNLEQSDIEIPEKIKPETVALLASLVTLAPNVIPRKQDFLDLADLLEKNPNAVPGLDQDTISALTNILRGEYPSQLG